MAPEPKQPVSVFVFSQCFRSMSDDEKEYNPEAPPPTDEQEQSEPSGERVVVTQGVTFTLKQEENVKTNEEDEDVLHSVYARRLSLTLVVASLCLCPFPRPSMRENSSPLLSDRRAKLYRFSPEEKEWKERGVGELKFLQHRDTKKIRILMRRDKILKICANHLGAALRVSH